MDLNRQGWNREAALLALDRSNPLRRNLSKIFMVGFAMRVSS